MKILPRLQISNAILHACYYKSYLINSKNNCIRSKSKSIARVFGSIQWSFSNSYSQQKKIRENFVNHQKSIENKWKNDVLNNSHKNSTNTGLKKKYILSMFPYPSGNLHLGHVRVYAIADVLARFYLLNGYKVIHPMGWDAFGLPAENAAMERDENPANWTQSNILKMKEQLNSLGCSFQWSREVTTCDPKYYKWTQKLFLMLYKAGLAYRQEAIVNWDPIDQTVLANEQVSSSGISWRSGAKVEKRLLLQWFIKSTSFSLELLEDLQMLPKSSWEIVSKIQKSWIGSCDGYNIDMKLTDHDGNIVKEVSFVPLWMKNPEHLQILDFIGVTTDHFLNQEKYIDNSVKEKNIKILKVFAVEPITKRSIPIIVDDNLKYADGSQTYVGVSQLNSSDKVICKNLNFKDSSDNKSLLTRDTILQKLKDEGAGGSRNSVHLRDWLVSRQRYWGTPIPIIHCQQCGTVPVPDEDLPVELPLVQGFVSKGMSVLKRESDWYNCKCPSCGQDATRETDTLDTFMDSSWYYLRYLDVNNNEEIVSKELADRLMPVDLYIGGIEHAALHLYYARFINKFLKSQGYISCSEPFQNLMTLAFVKSKSYQVKKTGKYISPQEVDFSVSPPVENSTREILRTKFDKMSKSKYNGIDPQSVFEQFGVDATRLTIVSHSDNDIEMKWESKVIADSLHFLEKVKFYVESLVDSRKVGLPNTPKISIEETKIKSEYLFNTRNFYIIDISRYIENQQFVHAAIEMRKFCNDILAAGQIMLLDDEYERALRDLLVMLMPFCPHFSAELWHQLNSISHLPEINTNENIFNETWPSVAPSYIRDLDCLINYRKEFSVKLPHSELSTLNEREMITMAKKEALERNILDESSILEEKLQSTNAVNLVTLTKDRIKRNINYVYRKEFVGSCQISQSEYENLNDIAALRFAKADESFLKSYKELDIIADKFTYEKYGDSEIKYIKRKRKK